MSAISKELFYDRIDENIKCTVLHVWTENCLKAGLAPEFLNRIIIGSGKFFLPMYLAQLLINHKKIKNEKFLLKLLMAHLRSVAYGIVMALLLLSGVCFFRAICGRFYYYNTIMLPGMLSGLSLLVESRENQIIDTLIFFNSFVETILNQLNISSRLQAIMFMGVSAFIMANFENRQSKLTGLYFWFYTPSRMPPKNIDNNCDHTSACPKYLWEGFKNYFAAGYALNIVRMFLSKSKNLLKKPNVIFNILFNVENCRSGLFLGSYVGLYRAITCYCTQMENIKPKKSSFIAGLLAGATYTIYPRIQILVIAVTTMLQMAYDFISKKLNITNHFWQMHLLFIVIHGYLLHCKFLYPQICSTYYKNMIDACSDGMAKVMYENTFLPKYFPELVKKSVNWI